MPARLALYRQLHPDVQIELNITNRNVDIIAEGFDLVVRRDIYPTAAGGKKLEDAALCLVASPAYLRSTARPLSKIADLRHHSCLTFIMPATGKVAEWVFREDGGISAGCRRHLCMSPMMCSGWSRWPCRAGICQSYAFIVQEAIARGSWFLFFRRSPDVHGLSRCFTRRIKASQPLPGH